MEDRYSFETFSSDASSFDRDFTSFLNTKAGECWKVKSCSYCHDNTSQKTFASCLFKRKS